MVWPILQSLLTLALLIAAGAFTASRLDRIVRLVRSGRECREKTPTSTGERIDRVLSLVFGHRKVLEDRWSGLVHMSFLYGFMVLGIGHLEVVLQGLTAFLASLGRSPFSYELVLPPRLLQAYHLSQDAMAFLVLVGVSVALGRRWSGKVKRLTPRSVDAETILYLILALYVTFFLLVGSDVRLRLLAGAAAGYVPWQPASSLVAQLLAPLPDGALRLLHGGAFWAHLGIFLGFACYIPASKHMHLIFAGPNIFFFRKERRGLPPALDFENSEKFGIDRFQELPWKTLLDSVACTECGRCNSVCPAHLTGKPLQPMKVLHDIKLNMRGANGDQLLQLRDGRGRPRPDQAEAEAALEPAQPLIARAPVDRAQPGALRADGRYLQVEGQVHVDEAWACTTCAACVQACPVLIDSVPGTLIGLRQNLVLMDSEFPKELTAAFKGMEVQGNPWGVGQDKREEWARSLDVPVMSALAAEDPQREVQYLFWVGCAGATDDRAKKVQQALVRILKASGVDFAILGCEEKCTGDPARRLGNEYVWSSLAQENVATLSQYKFKKIFTTCPHCFNQLKNEYPELGGHYTVQHHSELLAELLADGRIPLDTKRSFDEHVTFHDPCYLGRYNQGYDAPREVLVQLQVKRTEMPRSREKSLCCGAGGGRMFLEETIGKRVNVERTEEALATGAGTIVVGCPFCMTMLGDGTKAKNMEQSVKVRDLAELVAERLAEPPAQA